MLQHATAMLSGALAKRAFQHICTIDEIKENRGTLQVGLLVSSPLFAESSKHFNAFRLIAVGLGVWAVACAACGLAPSMPRLHFALSSFTETPANWQDPSALEAY